MKQPNIYPALKSRWPRCPFDNQLIRDIDHAKKLDGKLYHYDCADKQAMIDETMAKALCVMEVKGA